uniref:RING-type domain-containing protein n=1 Tax=Kalanchoe fedtschenkoi TaxID=63787 RepID=A0A7N0V3X0_KALFE
MASKDIQRKREEELDNLLRVEQGGRMKRELQERSRRHNMELLQTLNHQASKLIKQKDDQLQQANQKNMELQANVNTVQTEVDAWKNRAMAGRAIVHNLHNEVEKATKKKEKKGEGSSSKKMESSVGSNDHVVDPARACKVCTIRETCMILMPCRHMCCCRPCAHAVKLCPICGAANRQGLHVAMD